MNSINNSKPKRPISRRDFLKVSGLGLAALAAGGTYFNYSDEDLLEVKEVRLALPRLPAAFSGIRIAQVSDIHMGGWMHLERLQQAFSVVTKLAPDILALTGDFVNNGYESPTDGFELIQLETELKQIAEQIPTLAVLGNHDYFGPDSSQVKNMLAQSNIQLLLNSVHRFKIGNDLLYLAGVDDIIQGENRIDIVVDQLPEGVCAIMMAHEPDFADNTAATGRFDLQISGHSHGGQVDLPLFGPPILPAFAHKYPRGLYQVGKMFQYTNVGLGMTHPFVRFNCRPEITVFTLVSI